MERRMASLRKRGGQPGRSQLISDDDKKRSSPSFWQRHGKHGLPTVAGMVVMGCLLLVFRGSKPREDPSLEPFPARKLASLPQFQGSHAERLLWGTYRPGLYFGMRMRLPKSPLLGVMWLDPGRQDPLNNIRHEAQQRDGLKQYGWLQHDGESFGLQELHDEQLNITTAWAKRWCEGCSTVGDIGVSLSVGRIGDSTAMGAAGDGGRSQSRRLQSWEDEEEEEDEEEVAAVAEERGQGGRGQQQSKEQRQRAQQRAPTSTPAHAITLFIYMANEDGSPLRFDPAAAAAALRQPPQQQDGAPREAIGGSAAPLGDWSLHISRGARASSSSSSGWDPVSVNYLALQTPHLHNLTDAVRKGLYDSLYRQHAAGAQQYTLTLPNTAQPRANVAVLQVTGRVPLRLDMALLSGLSGGGSGHSGGSAAVDARLAGVTGQGLEGLLARRADEFESRFGETFGRMATVKQLPPGTEAVAKAALSNMLGGMGYFYGHSLVRLPGKAGGASQQQQQQQVVKPLWDAPLFSAVPSRSFFPRGFLWDEGFHQLLIRAWNPAISRDVLAHWLDLMTAPGWIAREQILGAEARSRVPDEFVVQSPTAANPPTFFLLLSEMSERVAAAAKRSAWDDVTQADASFLIAAWPRLKGWFNWFNATQAGPVPGSYRWRGRDASTDRELNPKTLTSGLDDYPRASHPSGEERHVDLRCWMARASRAMATIGTNLDLPSAEVEPFVATAALLEDFDSLNSLHLDAASGMYLDWGNHTEDVQLRQMVVLANGQRQVSGEMRRVVIRPPHPQFVPHYGYVSLFPLLMELIPPDSPILKQQLDLLRNPDHIWTEFGLRSLSKSSSLYQQHNTQHDPPYWRGPVWININFLAVKALQHYADASGPYQAQAAELHHALRWNLLRNLVAQYSSTGYIWEQYDDSTGRGKGSHPFTGWSALLVLMAAEHP